MYVLVRNDLPIGLQTAQAVHAAAYLAAEGRLKLYQHPTVTVLSVSSEKQLMYYWRATEGEGFLFREPDLDDEATAFACYSVGTEFAQLSLMGIGLGRLDLSSGSKFRRRICNRR